MSQRTVYTCDICEKESGIASLGNHLMEMSFAFGEVKRTYDVCIGCGPPGQPSVDEYLMKNMFSACLKLLNAELNRALPPPEKYRKVKR
jgi:hypothetical protein